MVALVAILGSKKENLLSFMVKSELISYHYKAMYKGASTKTFIMLSSFWPLGRLRIWVNPLEKENLWQKSHLASQLGHVHNSHFYTETNITYWQKLCFKQNVSYSVNTVKWPNIHLAYFIHLKDEFWLFFIWESNIGQKNFV